MDKYNLFIEGTLTTWTEEAKRIDEEISQRIGIDEFFEYIPKVEREENLQTTNEEGKLIEVKSPRWKVDNIFVFTDEVIFQEAANLPSWRFNFNQNDCERIIEAYIIRKENTFIIQNSNFSITSVLSCRLLPFSTGSFILLK